MLHPSYELKIGSQTITPATSDYILSIQVRRDLNKSADMALIKIRTKGPSLTKEESLSILMGYDDNLLDVYKGFLKTVNQDIASIKVMALNSMTKLLGLRINQIYENQSAGSIVSDLANTANIQTDQVSDGMQFPYYAVGSNKNIMENIEELAIKSGFDFYMTKFDKLVFKKYEASEPHLFEYGKNIVSLEKLNQSQIYEGVKVFGESPSSSKGSETYHWLTKKEVQGAAGTGTSLLLQDKSLKTNEAVNNTAEANLEKLKRIISVRVEVIGCPEIELGDTAEIKGMPDNSINGSYQVRSVEHFLSKAAGFVTTIGCSWEAA